MNEIHEIVIGLEGQVSDVNSLAFDLFEAGMIREGLRKEIPGGATIVLKPMVEYRSPLAHAIIEIALFAGKDVAVPLLVSWLYDKWKRQGEKPISIRIDNHFYQFDAAVMTRAIDESIEKRTEKDK